MSFICTSTLSENAPQYSWTKIFNKEKTNSNYLHQVTKYIKVPVSLQNKHSWSTHTVLIRICTLLGTRAQITSMFQVSPIFMSLTSSSNILAVQCNVYSQYMRQLDLLKHTSGIFSFNTRQYTQVLHKQHQAHTGNILEKTAGNWHKCFGRYSAQLLSSYNSVDNRLHMSSLQKVPTNCTQQLLQVQLLVHWV